MGKKTPKTEVIKPGDPDYMQPKTQEIMKLMDQGLTPEEACKLAKDKDNIHANTKTDLKQKHERWLLTRPAIVKLAQKAVKDTLQMKAIKTGSQVLCPECKGRAREETVCPLCSDVGLVNEAVTPTTTNRLAAAQMVMDRADPVIKKNLNINASLNFTDVSLKAFG